MRSSIFEFLNTGIYYPSKEVIQEENERLKNKQKQRRMSAEISTTSGIDLLMDGTGGVASPKADDWFSPKLTHYTQGRAM